ncbi:hypothetical protein GGP41_000383 [Bipolaris sorokiniana]|uniref:Uncharacterized protein n=1 Tax=Cochliobolus sativus TaxID=45130 RepID=A0A8H6DTQ7_COCSA|nr:hypothetical protein GGP41_000383 [Bipolaris sorokiniana]
MLSLSLMHSGLSLYGSRNLAPLNDRFDMVKWFYLVTFDLIGHLALVGSFGFLERSDEGGLIRNLFFFIKAEA